MLFFSSSLAIGWAHYRLAGGYKSGVIVGGAYFVLFGGLIAFTEYVARVNSYGPAGPQTLKGWCIGLMVLQAIILVLAGCIRISGCIRHDVSSRMLESHRLMPVTDSEAIAGYLWGGGAQVLATAIANMLLTYLTGSLAGVDLLSITVGHLVLSFFTVFAWTFVALGTFIMRYMILVLGGLAMLGTCTMAVFWAVWLLPGLMLLFSPFYGETIFKLVPLGGASWVWLYPVSMFSQTVLAIVFFLGAGRLYRGTYATTFRVWQSLVLLIIWCGLTAIGIFTRERFGPAGMFGGETSKELVGAQIIASTVLSFVIAMLPIWSVIKDDAAAALRVPATMIVLVLVWLSVCAPLIGTPTEVDGSLLLLTVVFAAQVAGVWAVLHLFRRLPMLALTGIVVLFASVFWVLPLIGEFVIAFLTTRREATISTVGMLSPIGTMLSEFHMKPMQPPVIAVALQCVCAAILTGIAIARAPRVPLKPGFPVTATPSQLPPA